MKGNVIKTVLLCSCLLFASACTSQENNNSTQSSKSPNSVSTVSEQSLENKDSAESNEDSVEDSVEESLKEVSSEEESSEEESSGEESSVNAEPAFSKDEIIDLLLKNESIWTKDTVSHAKEDDVKAEIRFFDMDWDGSEEFIASISRKNESMTDSYIYTVKNGELVCLNKVIGAFDLYKYYSQYPVMVSHETINNGEGNYTESYYRYLYNEGTLFGSLETYAVHDRRPEDGGEFVLYYVTEDDTNVRPDEVDISIREEVTEAGFKNSIEDATYDCEKIEYESDTYSGSDWLGLSDDQKKQTLSELYDSYKLK